MLFSLSPALVSNWWPAISWRQLFCAWYALRQFYELPPAAKLVHCMLELLFVERILRRDLQYSNMPTFCRLVEAYAVFLNLYISAIWYLPKNVQDKSSYKRFLICFCIWEYFLKTHCHEIYEHKFVFIFQSHFQKGLLKITFRV